MDTRLDAPYNSRIRFVADPWTGELGTQCMTTYGPGISQYDGWTWTDDLDRYAKVSKDAF